MDSLFFGVLLSYVYHYRPTMFRVVEKFPGVFLALGISLLAPAFVWPFEQCGFITSWGFSLLYIGSGSIMKSAVLTWELRESLFSPLIYIGSHSYCIYLWHMPVAAWGGALLVPWCVGVWGAWVILGAYLIGSLGVGILFSQLSEYLMLRLRDRLFPASCAALER